MVNKEALDTLQKYGIHPSVQRIAIMDYLLKNHTHPTVDEVYVALCKVIPTLSKTTVYNTLRLFSDHGAALMLTIDEKKVCFDGVIVPQCAISCARGAEKLFDVALPESLKDFLPVGSDFKVDEAHVYYKGVCKACAMEA
mgnify:CR=1 FL=1